ncbi:ribosome maturation factor RimM [Caenispirillum salinarum]|uniref:ribosome maturation factor RimM n=1 Tax=Caenispirillum salinarum TaxID=859058 RepID=UPI00384A7447
MSSARDDRDDRVLVGVIVGAHGIRGDVKVKSFTADPEAVAAYGPVLTEDGATRLALRVKGQGKGTVTCFVKGIADRTAAEALKGTRLYLPRQSLPAEAGDDEFYHADLVGLTAEMADGSGPVGEVVAVYDFGAGDVLELKPVAGGVTPKPVMVPFTRDVCPVVDVRGRRLVVDPPPGLIDAPKPGEQAEEAAAARGDSEAAGETE